MQETNAMRDRMIQEFTENYMEKLFYFCLRKTGSNTEAEDLTQDIALQIVAALNKGMLPTSFSAWVWQIARNRYSIWANTKHKRNESVTGSDIGDYEIEGDLKDPLDDMIYTEQMALLRRELSFIKSDYRGVVVAYYIENKSIGEIALACNLSQSAVKQRLFRAREILKEGMDMAREFGKLSYNPENIAFICNGCHGENKEPWSYISRALCKNILLAAYRNPATAEELAMEVGVALPYMEEELASLVESTLMKKNGNKYETAFFIVSAEAQKKIYAHLRGIAPELTKAVIATMEYEVAYNNENHPKWHDGYQPFEEMKWALLMKEVDSVNFITLEPFEKHSLERAGVGTWGHTIRPNGGEWDLLGQECYQSEGEEPDFVGLSGCVSSPQERLLPEIVMRQYRFKYSGMEKKQPPELTYLDGQALVDVANGKWEKVDGIILGRLASYGYIAKTEKGYLPTILVCRRENSRRLKGDAAKELEALRQKAVEIATRHYEFCREQIYKEIPAFLKDDVFQIEHACANIFSLRGAVLEEAIANGYLSFDKDNINPTVGAFLVL